jgi:xylulose-5-phosphate/fructose-6-phosphate phosphoketolase
VRDYKEEGTTTTPFDMTVLNDLDRFHMAGIKQDLRNKLIEHQRCIVKHGDDLPEIRDWKWPY